MICPHCGFSLEADKIIELDGFVIDPRGTATHNGRPLPFKGAEIEVLYALAAAKGRVLSDFVIGERLGCDEASNVVAVYLSRLRTMLTALGIPAPFANLRGRGHYWVSVPLIVTVVD